MNPSVVHPIRPPAPVAAQPSAAELDGVVFFDDDLGTLVVQGEIDVATAPAFAAALSRATPRDGRLDVDLSAVTFLGVAGLNVIATAAHAARTRGQRLRVTGAHGITKRVFECTDLAWLIVG